MPEVNLLTVIISFIALVLFVLISERKVLFYNASFFLFVFIGNLGYFFLGNSTTVEEAILANKITYITGCILPLFLMMLVLRILSSEVYFGEVFVMILIPLMFVLMCIWGTKKK